MLKNKLNTFTYILFLLLIIFLVFGNTIFNDFLHYDDYIGIINNEIIKNLAESFRTHNIRVIANALIYHFFGLNLKVFHLTSIFLHFINSALVFLIFKRLFSKKHGMLSGLIFAVHPVNVEVVAWLSGSIYLFSVLFNLLTIYLYVVFRKSNSAIWLAASLTVYFLYYFLIGSSWMMTIPPILFILDYYLLANKSRRFWYLSICLFLIPVILYLTVDLKPHLVARSIGTSQEYIGTTSVSKPLKIGRNLFKAFTVMIFPYKLTIVNKIYEGTFIDKFEILISYLGTFSLLVYLFRKDRKVFALFLASLLAAAPLFAPFDIAVNLAERYFYLSSVFFSGMIAYLIFKLTKNKRNSKIVLQLIFIILIVFSVRSFIRTFDWRSDETLWSSALATAPNNYKVYAELGNVYYQKNEPRQALEYYQKALEIRPVYPIVYHDIGLTFLKAGQLDNAKTFFEKSLIQDPSLSESYYRLGQIAKLENQPNQAKEYFKKALQLDSSNTQIKDELNSL